MTAEVAGAPSSSLRNGGHALLAWGLPLAVSLVATPIVVRGLGAEPYGLYALALGLGGQTLGLSLGRALTRHVAVAHASRDAQRLSALVSNAIGLCGLLGLLGTAALAVASGWLSRSLNVPTPLQAQAHAALLLTALSFPLAAGAQVLSALPQALQRYELSSRVAAGVAIGLGLATASLAALGHGVLALLGAHLAVMALGGLALLLLARRLLPGVQLVGRLQPRTLRELLRFSGAVFVYQACGLLLLLWERVYLTRQLGPAALTHYVVPMSLAVQFHAAVASLTGLLVPLSSAAIAKSDGARLRALYERSLRLALALVALFAVGTVAAGPAFLAAWMGAAFAERSGHVLVLQAATFGLLALGTVPWHVAEALERPDWNAALAFGWLVLAAPLLTVLTPAWGLDGAAAARLLGLAGLPWLFARVERALFGAWQARLWLDLLLRLALPSLGLFLLARTLLACSTSALAGLFLAAAAAPPAFLAAIWLVGYLPAQDRAWLLHRLRPAAGR